MEKPPYRILQVVAKMDRGGTETMLMNYYRAIDRSRVQFDFLVHYEASGAYDEEIIAMGGRIFRAMPIRPWNYPAYFRWLRNFFYEHAGEFTAIHAHIQENSGFALHYARKFGIQNRIMTSHVAARYRDYKFLFREFAHQYAKRNVTTRLACGNDAGKSLYRGLPYRIMSNAIDLSKFTYNPHVRQLVRQELGIPSDCLVIGHVGRFSPAKNHSFILSVFSQFLQQTAQKAKLVFVGTGELFDQIKEKANSLGLSGYVLFLGSRSDVANLLQAFDAYIMPSVYEGLPVSAIEAQAAGLPCILSDNIDKATDISGLVQFLSLNVTEQEWANAIIRGLSLPRKDTSDAIVAAGYDVHHNLEQLLQEYHIPLE